MSQFAVWPNRIVTKNLLASIQSPLFVKKSPSNKLIRCYEYKQRGNLALIVVSKR